MIQSDCNLDKSSRPEVNGPVVFDVSEVKVNVQKPEDDKLEAHCDEVNSEVKLGTVRRKIPRCPGVYVEGTVQGTPLWVTADTGASRTVLAKSIYDKIPEDKRPSLKESRVLLDQAGGSPLKDYGKAQISLHMGPHTFPLEVCVADIKDEMLLGMDVGDTYDVVTSRGVLVIDGMEVPCTHVKSDRVRRVVAPRQLIVPANSEAIFDAKVESFEEEDDMDIGELVIEPTPYFSDRHPLVMASSLVDVKKDMVAKVRIMNPFNNPATIHRNTVIAYAQHCEPDTEYLFDAEDSSEVKNSDNCRRLKFIETDEIHQVHHDKVYNSERTIDPPKVTSQPSEIGPILATLPSHLRDMFQRAAEGITDPAQLKQLAEVLMQYQDVFSRDDTDLGLTHLAEHVIETGDARPVKQPPRRIPIALAGEEKKAIDQMLKQGIIKESCSPWASPVVLVKKKNGKIRTCVDYRKLNSVTVKDAYPLPTTQECLDTIAGAKYFTSLDMTSGYNQIPVSKKDIPKTAFVTRHGLYEFNVMSFGLTNAPATFQRVMELALRGLQWSTCLVYLDDVLIFGSTFDEHLQRLKQVLERIRAANLKLKPEKCSLMQAEVPFLGHIVSKDGVQPNPENISKVMQWPEPTNVTEVRQFLGLCSYYRRFIKDFAVVAKPLTKLTCKDSPLIWTEECQSAFDELKSKLVGPDIMAFPRDDAQFILDTDACDIGIGAVLSQIQDGCERVIAYASRSLTKAERNYCVTDKELLALKYFVEYFKQYLLGREFLIRTDHQALRWLFSLKEPKGRIARWIEILSAFNFTVEYRPGKRHGNADGMSRVPSSDNSMQLACGPCTKCKKRVEDMQSSWQSTSSDTMPTRTSRLAEGGQNQSYTSALLSVIFSILFWVPNMIRKVSSTASSWSPEGSQAHCNSLRRAQPAQENSHALLQDDGRLRPKLMYVIQSVSKLVHSLVPNRIGKVETRSSSKPEVWFQNRSRLDLLRLQNEDPHLAQVTEWLRSGNRPPAKEMYSASPELRHYWNLWGTLELCDGLLFRHFHKRDGSFSHLQLLVPTSLRQEILSQFHDNVFSGHLGAKKTSARIFQKYYWYEFRDDVKIWVSQCDLCAVNKPVCKKPKAPLGDMRVGAPLDRLCIDVLGPLPTSENGNRYILVVCDSFTKWAEAFPIPDQTARTCASVLVENVICRLGCPLDLHSDQGRNFESDLFKELCDILQIRKTRTSPHHPQGNGQCERFNRTLLTMIRTFTQGDQDQWDQNLSYLTAAYRATPHESTGFTPNMLMLGREVRLPDVTHTSNSASSTPGMYCKELRKALSEAHEMARQQLKKSAQKQRSQYDVKISSSPYKAGDLVWYLSENRKEGICPKLQPLYKGPALVLKMLNEVNFQVQLDSAGTTRVLHHDKLKPYQGKVKLSWAKQALIRHEKKTR